MSHLRTLMAASAAQLREWEAKKRLEKEWANPECRKQIDTVLDALHTCLGEANLMRTDLVDIAMVLGERLPPADRLRREEKRSKKFVMSWFGKHAEAILPLIPFLVLQTDSGRYGRHASALDDPGIWEPSLIQYLKNGY
jgi:hypothetical protein